MRSAPIVSRSAQGLLPIGAVVALLVCSVVVQLLLTAQSTFSAGLFLLLLVCSVPAGMMLAVAVPAEGRPNLNLSGERPGPLPSHARALAAAALLCSAEAAWLVHAHGSATSATWLWVVGVLAVLLAAADPAHLAGLPQIPGTVWAWLHDGRREADRSTLVLLAILVAAAALRLPALDTVPAFVHSDEARNGLAARLVAQGHVRSLFSYGFADLPQLGYVWDALFLKLFGDSLFALRLSSAVVGIGSILLVAKLGEELFNRRTGLLAAAWLTVFHMHIHYSRLGHHYIQALFTLTLTLYLFARTARTGGRLAAVACGLVLAVDLQVYFAARIALMVVPVMVLYLLAAGDQGLPRRRGAILGWLPLGFVVGAAPVGALIASAWGAFTLRTRQVLVFGGTSDARSQVLALYGRSSAWHILREQIGAMLQTFNYSVDTSFSYLLPHQLLDPVSAALLPAALVFALYQRRGIGSLLCLGTFAAIVVTGGVLTIGQPYWPRLIALLPILALLLALLLDGLWSALEVIPRLALPTAVGACALLATIAYGNLWWYFGQYVPSARQNWLAAQTDAGEYLRSLPDRPSAYGLADPSFLITTPQIRFLAPGVPLCTVPIGPVLHFGGCPPSPGTDRVFLVTSGRLPYLPALRRLLPSGSLRMLHRYAGGQALYAYRVPGHTRPG